MVQYKYRGVFTSDGSNQGTGLGSVYFHQNVPEDAYYLPDVPGVYQDWEYNSRYTWYHDDKEWRLKPDAMPATLPEGYWAWDGSLRYDVDPSDPLRNSWVLKPDAQPVEPPGE